MRPAILADETSGLLSATEGLGRNGQENAITEENEDGDEDEGGEKAKIRSYDPIAIARRIGRLLPYLAPIQTLGVVCAYGTSIKYVALTCT